VQSLIEFLDSADLGSDGISVFLSAVERAASLLGSKPQLSANKFESMFKAMSNNWQDRLHTICVSYKTIPYWNHDWLPEVALARRLRMQMKWHEMFPGGEIILCDDMSVAQEVHCAPETGVYFGQQSYIVLCCI